MIVTREGGRFWGILADSDLNGFCPLKTSSTVVKAVERVHIVYVFITHVNHPVNHYSNINYNSGLVSVYM